MPKKTHYPQVEANPDFAALEESVLAFWQESRAFEKSVEDRPARGSNGKSNAYVFYDGPPFANGLPHYGHLLTGYVKDAIARYHTMKGARVERRFGWDCHGLPAEMGAEKELQLSGRAEILEYGIEKFNAHCRTSVMKYVEDWRYYVTRQGRWVDFDNDYKTMDKNFMESVLWAFKQLYDKGLVYESMRVMPYSWAAETPLSNFETKLDNSYRDRDDKAAYVKFRLKEKPRGAPDAKDYYLIAWTTTPWTLPANLALAVSAEMSYGWALKDNACYILTANTMSWLKTELAATVEKIETTHCVLRPFTAADEASYVALVGNPETMKTIGGGVRSPEDAKKELAHLIEHQKKHGFSIWAACDKKNGALLGKAGFTFVALDAKQPPQLSLHYLFAPETWGKGIAKEVAKKLVHTAFEQWNFDKIVAGTLAGNLPSVKIIESHHFTRKGDVAFKNITCSYYELTRGEFFDRHGIKGGALAGLAYEPLFPFFKDTPKAFKIFAPDFVTEGEGTGVVHMAPGFGEDDFKLCEAQGIKVVVPVDGRGFYTDEVGEFAGLHVIWDEPSNHKNTGNEAVLKNLKERGLLVKQETYRHSYPHCWRTDTPLIYRAMSSWYVEVTKFRDRAVEINKTIAWVPEHIRDGQMGHMLATAPDWSISRNRFWGTPIPVWRSPSGKIKVFGSIAELEKASGKKIADLHRPYIDEIVITDGGEEYKRVEDVFDCWFESGSMPFAQLHYPFENKEHFDENFPADFITEYVGQTRGWFNTLIMLSTALFDKAPFKHCICHGVVLDSETGLKYSKRLKNYKDPKEVMDQYGADALRWLMLSSPVMRGLDLAVDPEGKFIRDVVRLNIKPIWNAYNFFTLYANADGVVAKYIDHVSDRMDAYILGKCKAAVEQVQASFGAYDTPGATEAITGFFEVLNNWYIRRSRPRFWAEELSPHKQEAYDTLFTVLNAIVMAAAPLLPFVTEAVFQGLNGNKESVHWQDFPNVGGYRSLESLPEVVAPMDMVREICNAAHAVRSRANIRTRQPLSSLTVVGVTPEESGDYHRQLICDEVNVKRVLFVGEEEIRKFADPKIEIRSQIVGKKYPQKMKEILSAAKSQNYKILDNKTVEIAGVILNQRDECRIILQPVEKYKDSVMSLPSNDALVMLDLSISPELEAEGLARDLVRMIQQARKDAGLNVSDRIDLALQIPASFKSALVHTDYIKEQTLAVSLAEGKAKSAHEITSELDGETFVIGISKAA